ncbi:hypothetical protein [Bradyrhizobium sp. 164]|uniref:hypothetical protein n=1 Tax=Bradyrhizobium sp. 164 TaxID=2782637 RepID=UPI001FF7939F|nr:hypothetical protein [Bradyrhizobium sp. 164]MCK1595922.1 hypothetical protein [Bradyrhizobium sp. 164]
MINRVIDPGFGKLDRQRWRRWSQRAAHGGRGHADRAEIIGMTICRMALARAAIGRFDGCDQHARAFRNFPVKAVDVTEGERKVDGKRDQRKP